jgi:hypothetical protein
MMFCSHCGKSAAEGARFCAACGKPIAPDAVAAVTVELHRHRKQMRLMLIALGLVAVVTAGIIVIWVMSTSSTGGRALSGGETSAPMLQRQQQPLPEQPAAVQTPPGPAFTPSTTPTITPTITPDPVSRPSVGRINTKAVEDAVSALAPPTKQQAPSSQPTPAISVASVGSDSYPGSRPVDVKNANLPDIGIPVAGEVYSTSDSVATVVSYYTQRYPDAEVMEISGQKIIAVSSQGVTKVIAVGTTGEETRIAIVQPHN